MVNIDRIRKAKGSPVFNFANAEEITGSCRWQVSIGDGDDARAWMPFDDARIINSSNFDVWFINNQRQKFPVKSNSMFPLDAMIESFSVIPQNEADVIPVRSIQVALRKKAITQDEIVQRREGKGFLGRLLDVF